MTAIKNLEPETEVMIYNWTYFWKRLKSIKGSLTEEGQIYIQWQSTKFAKTKLKKHKHIWHHARDKQVFKKNLESIHCSSMERIKRRRKNPRKRSRNNRQSKERNPKEEKNPSKKKKANQQEIEERKKKAKKKEKQIEDEVRKTM
ncbi:4729_t:CDS:2 [Racocetra persica]|uniref:4729_t:CDS:1 n=1 Tax=Racocetra persica TaxID=160502 RepID=A0ACA9QSB8_9GLOM|nr:4729_t:CDS:2 [Racocetra persica]